VFIAVPSAVKPFVPLATLLPQLGWLAFVVTRARRVRLGRWG
jgi:hypothetical protein